MYTAQQYIKSKCWWRPDFKFATLKLIFKVKYSLTVRESDSWYWQRGKCGEGPSLQPCSCQRRRQQSAYVRGKRRTYAAPSLVAKYMLVQPWLGLDELWLCCSHMIVSSILLYECYLAYSCLLISYGIYNKVILFLVVVYLLARPWGVQCGRHLFMPGAATSVSQDGHSSTAACRPRPPVPRYTSARKHTAWATDDCILNLGYWMY